MRARATAVWLGLAALAVASAALSVTLGPAGFSLDNVDAVLQFRLPRVILGLIAGGVLGLVGAVLQGMLRNPLADPFTLGVAGGAALGSSVVLVTGAGTSLLLPAGGFAGAAAATAAVYLLARIRGRVTMTGLVLAGVIISFLLSSLLMLLMVARGRSLGEAVFLSMGHLGVVFTRTSIVAASAVGLLVLAGCAVMLSYSRHLDIMSLSEESALSLGIETGRLTATLFLLSAFLVGAVVAFTGAISFVGLVVPHLARMALGPGHRRVLPASFLLGAALLVLSDVVARNIVPGGLPLSVVTAFLGVPFFIYLMRRRM